MSNTAVLPRRRFRDLPHRRLIVAVVVAAVMAPSAYALTASNTVPASNVGAGTSAVTGYVLSNIHYALNATTPKNIDSLTFTVAPVVPSTSSGKVIVQVALSAGGPNTYTCTTNTTGETVTCATTSPQLTADTVTGVTVVAAQ